MVQCEVAKQYVPAVQCNILTNAFQSLFYWLFNLFTTQTQPLFSTENLVCGVDKHMQVAVYNCQLGSVLVRFLLGVRSKYSHVHKDQRRGKCHSAVELAHPLNFVQFTSVCCF